MQSRKPWLVRQVLIDSDDLWNGASNTGWIRCGIGGGGIDGIPFRRLPRLWKSDPLLSSDILPLLKEWIMERIDPNSNERIENAGIKSDEITSKTSLGLVWDLGCGADENQYLLSYQRIEGISTFTST
jgi:hypothetical protein